MPLLNYGLAISTIFSKHRAQYTTMDRNVVEVDELTKLRVWPEGARKFNSTINFHVYNYRVIARAQTY
jgi:hypothetical protein